MSKAVTLDMDNPKFVEAMNKLFRTVLPFMDHGYGYFTDLIYDFEKMSLMKEGDTAFVMVRGGGTMWAHSETAVREMMETTIHSGIVEVECVKDKWGDVRWQVNVTNKLRFMSVAAVLDGPGPEDEDPTGGECDDENC